MQVAKIYSHLNGHEFLLMHRKTVWQEILDVVHNIDAQSCQTKVSREKKRQGNLLYSPVALNEAFKAQLQKRGWAEHRVSYWVAEDEKIVRQILPLPPEKQKEDIERAGFLPIRSYNQTDYLKERVAIEVQFGKYAFVAYDLFVKHLAFYMRDQIDVGVEILPMKSMQRQMSSGIAYYEGELYNILRHGRSVPAVPLVLIGIQP